ncbi:hypothetical protein [Novosphingobium sp. CECT 9465]|uniref:hypothetical protein n=1 Tax=Novosphingobium sp. CECT 9465 TaxID=2829794 RepID=UPI001E395578|nr:hypothetical protein [Novosphingobium sp. CECT 9465]CAH0498054.1 hypothetical protein NVSP9465_03129 [Novosphingobium sp. CECT 9465]
MLAKGRFAELLPVNFAEPFDCDYHPNALPLLISFDDAADVSLPDSADLGDPPFQPRTALRLASILFSTQQAAASGMASWHGADGNGLAGPKLRASPGPATTPQGAIRLAGADDLDPNAPVVVVPLFKLRRKEVAALKFTP